MDNNILPLGTVVTLKNGDGTQLMIIARASVVEEDRKQVYYDYGAVLIPQGMVSPEAVYFFNKENVAQVIFEGFRNKEEDEFENQYDSMISHSDYIKGSVD